MKKIFGLLLLSLVANVAWAKKASLFTYDRTQVERAMLTVNVVDKFLDANPMDLDALLSNSKVIGRLAAEANMPVPAFSDTLKSWAFWGNLVITAGASFVLGILGVGCGLVGILVVYLITSDRDQTLNALFGCIGGSVIGYGCLLIYVALM